jgi:hypothetical protein
MQQSEGSCHTSHVWARMGPSRQGASKDSVAEAAVCKHKSSSLKDRAQGQWGCGSQMLNAVVSCQVG